MEKTLPNLVSIVVVVSERWRKLCLILCPWSVLLRGDGESFALSCAHGQCCFRVMEKALPILVSIVGVVLV